MPCVRSLRTDIFSCPHLLALLGNSLATPGTDSKTREEIHLPPPSAVPLVTAIGLSILVVGLIVDWVLIAVGGIVLIVSILWWIADAERDYDNLPE